MGIAACILEHDPRGAFRDMIHDEVDKWVDKIIDEVFVDGKEPTVMESRCKRDFPKRNRSFWVHVFRHFLSRSTQAYWSRNTPLARDVARCVKDGAGI
jgi:hypothetical protein